MSRRALILGGCAVLAALAIWAFVLRPAQQASTLAEAHSGIVRHAFLDNLNLEDPDTEYALLLHGQATGDGLRVVRDAAALRAAQGTAYYTDAPNAAPTSTLQSVQLLDPPGMPPHNAFVSVLKEKQFETTFTCYVAFCEGAGTFDPPHSRDMAGLLEASEPVEQVTESYRHHDKVRAAMFRLLKDPDVVWINPPNLPAPNSIVFPSRVRLHLPAILLETDATGEAPIEALDEGALEARFIAAFTHAYPETDAYRLGPLQITAHVPPPDGWLIMADETDTHVRDAEGLLGGLDQIMVIEATVILDLTPRVATALKGPDAFVEMPAFLPREPASVSERLTEIAEAHLGQPCPECFKLDLPVATDEIHVEDLPPPSFPLSYYRIKAP